MELLEYLPIPAGLALLLFGRKLFWLLLAATGFLVGFLIASQFVESPESSSALIVGLVFGAIGALLALFAQKIAIALGGFLAGGYAAMTFAAAVTALSTIPAWIPFLIGGIAGALLLRQVFEWTLLVLTSVIGAILILQPFDGGSTIIPILTILLAVVGIVIQARSKSKK
jgi:Domain of unknown function (DUF4203)